MNNDRFESYVPLYKPHIMPSVGGAAAPTSSSCRRQRPRTSTASSRGASTSLLSDDSMILTLVQSSSFPKWAKNVIARYGPITDSQLGLLSRITWEKRDSPLIFWASLLTSLLSPNITGPTEWPIIFGPYEQTSRLHFKCCIGTNIISLSLLMLKARNLINLFLALVQGS